MNGVNTLFYAVLTYSRTSGQRFSLHWCKHLQKHHMVQQPRACWRKHTGGQHLQEHDSQRCSCSSKLNNKLIRHKLSLCVVPTTSNSLHNQLSPDIAKSPLICKALKQGAYHKVVIYCTDLRWLIVFVNKVFSSLRFLVKTVLQQVLYFLRIPVQFTTSESYHFRLWYGRLKVPK